MLSQQIQQMLQLANLRSQSQVKPSLTVLDLPGMIRREAGARNLFQRLGFEQEAVLREHALDAHGLAHDLLVLSFHTRQHPDHRCGSCGVSVLAPLVLEGVRLCSLCYELRYEELGSGD